MLSATSAAQALLSACVLVSAVATGGCAPRIAELEEAGYYSARERNIRAKCDRDVYADGQKLGPATVYSTKEKNTVVESVIKARIYNPEMSVEDHNALFEATGIDVKRLDALTRDCRLASGSMPSAKMKTILARKKPN